MGPQAENPRNPRTGSWDSRGGLFILPEVSLGLEALDRTPAPDTPLPAPGESPPTCSRGVPPTCSGGAASAPRPGSVSPRGDTLCCSVSVLCDFGLRRSF